MRRTSAAGWARVGAALVAAAVLAGCGGDDGEADEPALRGVVRTPPLEVADVRLPDAANGGEDTAMTAPAGELRLLYFGYTSCPDICPTTMSDLSVAVNDLPAALADRVTVGMATVDPERDTDEMLTGYLDHFFDRSLALRTEDPETLTTATEAFGVQFEIEEHDPGDAYAVSHTAVTYVVDDTGRVVVEWPFGFDTRDMTADLTTLLDEEPT